jgi:hypothetical protein
MKATLSVRYGRLLKIKLPVNMKLIGTMTVKNFVEPVPKCLPVSIAVVKRAITCVAAIVHTQCQNTSVVAASEKWHQFISGSVPVRG